MSEPFEKLYHLTIEDAEEIKKRSIKKWITILIALAVTSILILLVSTIDIAEIMKKYQDNRRLNHINQIKNALEDYKEHHFYYPQYLTAINQYLTPIPNDPFTKEPYGYAANEELNHYELNVNMQSVAYRDLEIDDGGDNEDLYEVGTDKSIIQEGLFNKSGENPIPQEFEIIYPKTIKSISMRNNEEGCRIKTTISWTQAEDPGDQIVYYIYIDDENTFTDPEIAGVTYKTSYELDETITNLSCTVFKESINLLVIAEDSAKNLTEAPPLKIINE